MPKLTTTVNSGRLGPAVPGSTFPVEIRARESDPGAADKALLKANGAGGSTLSEILAEKTDAWAKFGPQSTIRIDDHGAPGRGGLAAGITRDEREEGDYVEWVVDRALSGYPNVTGFKILKVTIDGTLHYRYWFAARLDFSATGFYEDHWYEDIVFEFQAPALVRFGTFVAGHGVRWNTVPIKWNSLFRVLFEQHKFKWWIVVDDPADVPNPDTQMPVRVPQRPIGTQEHERVSSDDLAVGSTQSEVRPGTWAPPPVTPRAGGSMPSGESESFEGALSTTGLAHENPRPRRPRLPTTLW